MKLLLKLAFLGTNYCGYQVQKNGATIQEELNKASKALFGFDCDIVGCSRTDSGVHANEFCATVCKKGASQIETSIPIQSVPSAFNSLLPSDIAVKEASFVPDTFHARYDVKYKEYVYRFYNGKVRDPFEEGRSLCLPKPIDKDTVELMSKAAGYFCGTHDFLSYMAQGSRVESTIRTVFYAEVFTFGDIITFKVAADGFLYNMVRIMAGTLLMVANGKIPPEDIVKITDSRNRCAAGMTAPAYGLYLNKVEY